MTKEQRTRWTNVLPHGAPRELSHLSQSAKQVSLSLNVFSSLPDDDTGTDMNLTLSSGVDEMNRNASSHIGEVAGALSRFIVGGEGNSGVKFCHSCFEVLRKKCRTKSG